MWHTLVLDPVALRLGPITVHWYGIILGLGALAGLALAVREGKRFGIAPDFFMDMLLIGVPSAVIAARIYYVAFRWHDYRHDFLSVFKIWEGGIAIYGALIGAVLSGWLYVRYKGYPFWRIADIAAPSLIVGQAIGRWGNFVNQEAYGGPVTEAFLRDGLHLPNFIVEQMLIDGVYRHPTFLYESVWNFAGLLLLFALRRMPFVRAGEVFLGYFLWYSIGRFFIEGLRTDSLAFTGPQGLADLLESLWAPMTLLAPAGDMAYGNIRISQLVAVLLVIGCAGLILFRRTAGLAVERYADPIRPVRKADAAQGADAASGTDAAASAAEAVREKDETSETGEKGQERNETHDTNRTV